MKIKTNIQYQETYLPPRCRIQRYRMASKMVTTTIKEASYADAPIAISYQDCLNGNHISEDGTFPSGVVADIEKTEMWYELRWYNNHLYQRVFADTKLCNARGAWPVQAMRNYYANYNRCGSPLTCANATRHLRQELRSLLLLDGDIWKQCGEPVYVIATFGLGHNHASTDLMTHKYFRGYTSEYFNALEREEAIAECKRVALARGDTNSIDHIGKFWMIAVLMPEAVQAPPHVRHQLDDGFAAQAEAIIRASGSAAEAGLLVVTSALCGMK
ncbi:MAG: hypothetical protein RR415_12835 [Ruthenibacterium sp.]